MQEEEYRFDQFDDGSEPTPAEVHLENLKKFATDYREQIEDIHLRLDQYSSSHWNLETDPIALSFEPYEQAHVLQLVASDGGVCDKVLKVMLALCIEIDELKRDARNKFFPGIALFGHDIDEAKLKEGELAAKVGAEIVFFRELHCYVTRGRAVVQNLVRQLAALYYEGQRLYTSTFRNIRLVSVWQALGDLLTVMLTLDELIQHNRCFLNAWNAYKRMLKNVRVAPERYNTREDQIRRFEKIILTFEGELMEGKIFQGCIAQPFHVPQQAIVYENQAFMSEFLTILKILLATITERLGRLSETTQRRQLVGLAAMYVMYTHIFQDRTDRKFFKQLWDTQKKVPVVHLYASSYFWLGKFLLAKDPELTRLAGRADFHADAISFVRSFDSSFPMMVHLSDLSASTWMARMEASLRPGTRRTDAAQERLTCLTSGILLANNVSHCIKTYISLHSSLNEPMTHVHVHALASAFCLLKAIQYMFFSKSQLIADYHAGIIQDLCSRMHDLLATFESRNKSLSKRMDASTLDVLSVAQLALRMVRGPLTPDHIKVIRICLEVIAQRSMMREADLEELRAVFRKVQLLGAINEEIQTACCTDFIYWCKELVPEFFASLYRNPLLAPKLKYLLACLNDPLRHLTESARQDFKEEITCAFETSIIEPLCRDIEVDLRVHAQRKLAPDAIASLRAEEKQLYRWTQLPALHLFDHTIDLAERVSHYLDTTFYNLTTIALHDWRTYGEMKNLARQKYGLRLINTHLPTQTLEQGLDVLEIMRNVHVFVAHYHYNINSQIFIERTADNKTLNTISIRHIANSIRTHGTGIMNTTVNIIFQFLAKKIRIFAHFLQDEHIKARLIKDVRFFTKEREALGNMYPWDRAMKFNRDIRKLGLTDQGLSYLDQFRALLTEIGNALGFVRMVRSGGLRYCSEAIKFVPDLDNILEFQEHVQQENLSADTQECARNLDAVLENLTKNFAEETDFFRLLVNVFKNTLKPDRSIALRSFYCIVPPLTINFVDAFLTAKDRLNKKHRGGAFSDDGFAIGLAFFLQLLAQCMNFDSLHWFKSVEIYLKTEEQKIAEQLHQRRRPQDELQTLQLTLKKLEIYRHEFELLFYSFSGARIFFKNYDEDDDQRLVNPEIGILG